MGQFSLVPFDWGSETGSGRQHSIQQCREPCLCRRLGISVAVAETAVHIHIMNSHTETHIMTSHSHTHTHTVLFASIFEHPHSCMHTQVHTQHAQGNIMHTQQIHPCMHITTPIGRRTASSGFGRASPSL